MKKIFLVYLIQMGNTNYYKIGSTSDINKRLSSLQTGNPLPLRIATTFEVEIGTEETYASHTRLLEKTFHKAFAYCRECGEWFKFNCNEQEEIIKLSQTFNAKSMNNFFKLFCKIGEIGEQKATELLKKS